MGYWGVICRGGGLRCRDGDDDGYEDVHDWSFEGSDVVAGSMSWWACCTVYYSTGLSGIMLPAILPPSSQRPVSSGTPRSVTTVAAPHRHARKICIAILHRASISVA